MPKNAGDELCFSADLPPLCLLWNVVSTFDAVSTPDWSFQDVRLSEKNYCSLLSAGHQNMKTFSEKINAWHCVSVITDQVKPKTESFKSFLNNFCLLVYVPRKHVITGTK